MNTLLMRFLLVLVAGLLFAACAAPAPTVTPTKAPAAAPPTPTPVPVKVRYVQTGDVLVFSPVYVARERYFKEEGIDLEIILTKSGAESMAAFLGGNADFNSVSVGDNLITAAKGQPIVVLAAVQGELALDLIMHSEVAARLGITYEASEEAKIKALKGLKIGITSPGSATDQVIRFLLRKYNLDPDKDTEIVAIGVTGGVAALAAKRLDAYLLPPPQAQISMGQGIAVWMFKGAAGDIKDLSPYYLATLATSKGYLEKNPDVVKRFVRAIVKAHKLIKENPNEAKTMVRSFFQQMDAAQFEDAWKATVLSFGEPAVTKRGLESAYRLLKGIGIEIPLTYEQVVNPTFVEDAKKEVGFK